MRQELTSITERISEIDMREKCIQEFIDKAKSYIEMPRLTPELLRVFICKIEVYEKAEKILPYRRESNHHLLCISVA